MKSMCRPGVWAVWAGSPDPCSLARFGDGETCWESHPWAKKGAVEQSHEMEHDVFEVNTASFRFI